MGWGFEEGVSTDQVIIWLDFKKKSFASYLLLYKGFDNCSQTGKGVHSCSQTGKAVHNCSQAGRGP